MDKTRDTVLKTLLKTSGKKKSNTQRFERDGN